MAAATSPFAVAARAASPLPFSSVRLRCPDCRDELAFTPVRTQPFADGTFGVLVCGCAAYPVLDDVPVLRRGRVDQQDHVTGRAEVAGPTAEHLVALLRADRALDALVAMLALPPRVPFGLGSRSGLRLPFTRGPWPHLARAARRAEVRAMLDDRVDLTAQDWMELCYSRSSDRISAELLPYFFVKFGQPRFLASISLLAGLPRDSRPVLDLACGFGHVLHHLAVRDRPTRGVGVDRNFFQLWVARRYVAPMQTFVCADRPEDLPFDDDAFSAAVCADAFHYFDHPQAALDELRRVAVDDTVVLDRLGNAALAPVDGEGERDAAGYVALLRGAPWRLTCEDELLDLYRTGEGPRLRHPRHAAEFDRHKWLMLVSSRDESLFADHGTFATPPHGAGMPQINPVFAVTPDDDAVRLDFAFPSTWYAFENAAMRGYTSAGERMDPATFAALADGVPTEDLDDYVRRFVVLGGPPRYARRPGTPPRHRPLSAGLRAGIRRR